MALPAVPRPPALPSRSRRSKSPLGAPSDAFTLTRCGRPRMAARAFFPRGTGTMHTGADHALPAYRTTRGPLAARNTSVRRLGGHLCAPSAEGPPAAARLHRRQPSSRFLTCRAAYDPRCSGECSNGRPRRFAALQLTLARPETSHLMTTRLGVVGAQVVLFGTPAARRP